MVRRIEAVVFDLGETLVDETRQWDEWADWLGIPALTLFAAMGAAIAARQHHLAAFELLRPGFDMDAEREARDAAGRSWNLDAIDLYPDAVPCLDVLRASRLRLGIVGNQPAAVEAMLPEIHSRADVVGSSGSWGIEKPDPAFFARVVTEIGVPAGSVAYVGDRLDNDVLPAVAAGMAGIHVRRGPWGVAARSARLAAASLLVAGIALFAGGGSAEAYGTRHPIPGSTTACTANGTSYAQTVSYSKTINITGCNNVQARIRYNNGTVSVWRSGGSGTASISSSSNTVVGGGHRRCETCTTYNT